MQTISEEYLGLNRQLHAQDPSYGTSGGDYAPAVLDVYRKIGAASLLDYGSGKGALAEILKLNGVGCAEYDPAVEGKDTPPEPADLVYCGDVAEHVEPAYIEAFLDELMRVTRKTLLLVVCTRPARKFLSDGRNAHLTVEPVEWWLPKLRARFHMNELQADKDHFVFLGEVVV